MRLQTLFKVAATLSLFSVISLSDQAHAQSGCARCVAPGSPQLFYGAPRVQTGVTTRFRPEQPIVEDTPSVPSPFYSTDRDQPDAVANGRLSPNRKTNPQLIPTDSVNPNATQGVTPNQPAPQVKPNENRPAVADRISQRYADPRVIRMLSQLTPSGIESLYSEVSDLIDGRHITPATYAKRVDNALDHLTQALEVPSFVEAAQLNASPAALSSLKDDLQELRTTLWVRNRNDALSAMRKVQLMVAESIDANPAAVGMEFVYGATDSLDQFSMLLPPEKNGGPSVGLRDNVVGIGVEVEAHPSGLKILKLVPGGPAAQADLRRGDIITQVDGHDLKQLELNQAVDYIVGPVGSPIQIQAARGGRSGRVTLTRQQIAVHSVVDVHVEDASKGIAYLKLEQFADSTINEIDTALMNLHQQGMQSLIMDLRGNPGGLLTTAIALSDRFLPAGTIVSTRGRTQDDNTKETAHYAKTWRMPLVVLMDHNSASASEIFAAAIQENGRGLVVGERSYGKGTVQTLFPLQSFPAALRLTTAKFYSPKGREMAGAGVTPDVKVVNQTADNDKNDAVMAEALRQIVDPKTKEMANNFRRTGSIEIDSRVATSSPEVTNATPKHLSKKAPVKSNVAL
jgi:carboxyl-terminal processing protease